MRLIASLDDFQQATIIALIKPPHLEEPELIRFLVDTGCTKTTLLTSDIIRLRINWEDLPSSIDPFQTAGGLTTPRILSDVILYIPVKYGWFYRRSGFLTINISQIPLIPPSIQAPAAIMQSIRIPYHATFSLLGMDVLRTFTKWKYETGTLILDE